MKRKKKRRLSFGKIVLILIILLILSASAALMINGYVKAAAGNRIISSEKALSVDADCILVLGAGVNADNKPTAVLRDRLMQGVSLYQLGAAEKLLMSGDHGRKDYDEVNVMKNFAKESGVPSQDIFMDHAGFATYDSIYRAKAVFQAKKIIIVTQKYHLYRALYIAEKLGLDAYGVPTEPKKYKAQDIYEMREIMARVKDFFQVMLKPKPTYLGEAIPVSGDGNVTND